MKALVLFGLAVEHIYRQCTDEKHGMGPIPVQPMTIRLVKCRAIQQVSSVKAKGF